MEHGAKKAVIAMSGGVDSSVAALLTKNAGYDCVGVTMKLFENSDVGESVRKPCCSLEDADDARRVAQSLGMPFYIFDFTDEFRSLVIDRFVEMYLAGLTPNPCIDCNRYLKYEKLMGRALAMGFDTVVTGHYARVSYDERSGRFLLKRSVDESKDQSYVLYMLSQDQLAHARFPVGDLTKDEIRRIAKEHGFANANKPDSQDICFVREGGYADFIRQYSERRSEPGHFLDTSGHVIGEHEGIYNYTIGQRKGLGAFGRPMYVIDIRPDTDEIVLGSDEDLFADALTAHNINLIRASSIESPKRVEAKIRYSHKAQPATVTQTDEDEIKVVFDKPVRAITKGQAVVLYDGDIVVGGGIIA